MWRGLDLSLSFLYNQAAIEEAEELCIMSFHSKAFSCEAFWSGEDIIIRLKESCGIQVVANWFSWLTEILEASKATRTSNLVRLQRKEETKENSNSNQNLRCHHSIHVHSWVKRNGGREQHCLRRISADTDHGEEEERYRYRWGTACEGHGGRHQGECVFAPSRESRWARWSSNCVCTEGGLRRGWTEPSDATASYLRLLPSSGLARQSHGGPTCCWSSGHWRWRGQVSSSSTWFLSKCYVKFRVDCDDGLGLRKSSLNCLYHYCMWSYYSTVKGG